MEIKEVELIDAILKVTYKKDNLKKQLTTEKYMYKGSNDHLIKNYENGKIKYIQHKIGTNIIEDNYKNGELTEKILANVYYENKEFHLQGIKREYFDGIMIRESEFVDNFFNGESREYTSKGDVFEISVFEKGEIQSTTIKGIKFTDKDELVFGLQSYIHEVHLRSDFFEGKYQTFYENGNLQASGEFSEGKKNGNFYEYSQSGELIRAEFYSNGEFVKDLKEEENKVIEFNALSNNQKLEKINENFENLKYMTEVLNNKEFMLKAIKINSKSFEFASAELKNNKDFVLQAITQNGENLKFASENLKNDMEIVEAAVKEYGISLKFAADRFKKDKEFVKKMLDYDIKVLKYASEEIKSDKKIAIKALTKDPYAFNYISEKLIKNYENGNTLLKSLKKEYEQNSLKTRERTRTRGQER